MTVAPYLWWMASEKTGAVPHRGPNAGMLPPPGRRLALVSIRDLACHLRQDP